MRRETGHRVSETGDVRQEMCDRRQEMRHRRYETGDVIQEK